MEYDSNPQDIKHIHRSLRYFWCKAFASFGVHNAAESKCGRTWKSAHAWCTLDLKKQCIAHCFRQECKSCGEMCAPNFDKESFRRMAKFAVDRCLMRMERNKHKVSKDISQLNLSVIKGLIFSSSQL